MSFLNELKRRNVFRAGIAYVVMSWLILQVADIVFPRIGLPDTAVTLIIAILAIGFIPVLIFSWVFEMTGDGLKREKDIDHSKSINLHTGRKLDRMIILMLVLALTYFVWDKFSPPSEHQADDSVTDMATAEPIENSAAVSPGIQKSIAVLPFVNMSADADNEYFSDGISEEILNALVQVGGLKVAGRTSSFYFKGKNESFATIGKALGVSNVLEGSVRKQGDKVRITAQLIRVKDGFHIWSETYNGDLQDVFALQENIARAITSQLQVLLQGKQLKRLVPVATASTVAHDLFLRATQLANNSDEASLNQAISFYKQAIAEDPDYAQAWAGLARAYLFLADAYHAPVDLLPAMISSINKAIELDPLLADAYAYKGYILNAYQHDFPGALAALQQAVRLNPGSSEAHFFLGMYWVTVGNTADANKILLVAEKLDPLNPFIPFLQLWNAMGAQDYQSALKAAKQVLELEPEFSYFTEPVIMAYAAFGHWQQCIDRFQETGGRQHNELNYVAASCYAHNGDRATALSILAEINKQAQNRYVDHTHIAELYTALGDHDAAIDALQQAYRDHSAPLLNAWFLTELRPLADDPRYRELMDKMYASLKPGERP